MRNYVNLIKIFFISTLAIISTFQSLNSAAAGDVILDNGRSGTSSTGTWKTSSGANPYGSNSVYSKLSGNTYTYKFNLAAPGEYQVFARWTEWSNRRTSVPYDIIHSGGTSTIKVNQKQNGGKWNKLGTTWSFGSTATIKLRSLGSGTTCADAIRLVPVGGGNSAPVVKAIGSQSVNAGNKLSFNVSATDSDGASPVLSAQKLPPNAVFIDNNNGTGAFTWHTTAGDTGNYNVNFIATDTSDPTVTGRRTVPISVVDGSAGPVTLDNGQSGTSSVGTWKKSSGANPYGSNSVYSKLGGDTYTYKFNLAAPGEYQVFARWTEWSNRRTSVPYDIIHSGGTRTIKVNQRQNGGQWIKLGTTWNFGSTATIRIRSLGSGTTSADAIKIVPTGSNGGTKTTASNTTPSTATAVFQHNFNNEALHTYTQQDLKKTWNSLSGISPNAVKIVRDPDPSGSHGKSMQVFYAANSIISQNNSGAGWRTKIGRHKELYFAYDVYFENDAQFVLGGKLPGLGIPDYFSAAGVRPDGTDRWTGGLMWRENGKISNYIYHANQSGPYGDVIYWDDGPTGQVYFQKGKWNRIEMYYKMNTPGVLNGRLKGWLNGQLALDTNKIMYRMPGGEHLDIGNMAINTFYGGGDISWAPTKDQHIYFDNFVVSTQPITH
jgi:hypothetical protein